jgi:hypothetical protein
MNLRTKWRWVVSFMFKLLYALGKKPSVSLRCNVGYALEPTWMQQERKRSQHPPGIEPKFLCLPASILVTVLTRLSQPPMINLYSGEFANAKTSHMAVTNLIIVQMQCFRQ